jgi:hypothetical protein
MTVKTVGPFRRGLYGLVAGGLLSATASLVIALPLASADPQQQCNTTVGQTASQTVQSYLDRHPDVKAELTARSRPRVVATVRQHLIDLANQCTS